MGVDNATLVVCAVIIAVTGSIAYLLMRRHEKRLAVWATSRGYTPATTPLLAAGLARCTLGFGPKARPPQRVMHQRSGEKDWHVFDVSSAGWDDEGPETFTCLALHAPKRRAEHVFIRRRVQYLDDDGELGATWVVRTHHEKAFISEFFTAPMREVLNKHFEKDGLSVELHGAWLVVHRCKTINDPFELDSLVDVAADLDRLLQ